MVPCFDRYSLKMSIRGKPIRFGFKIWMLCEANSYSYYMSIYSGRDQGSDLEYQPLGTRVVNQMLQVVQAHSNILNQEISLTNFFTSYDLLSSFGERNVRAVGTIRDNRTSRSFKSIVSFKALSKKPRSSFDYRYDCKVIVCKCNDNFVVNIASNYLTHKPIHKASRMTKQQTNATVGMPLLVKQYKQGMGGVDVMNRLLVLLESRPIIRGKK